MARWQAAMGVVLCRLPVQILQPMQHVYKQLTANTHRHSPCHQHSHAVQPLPIDGRLDGLHTSNPSPMQHVYKQLTVSTHRHSPCHQHRHAVQPLPIDGCLDGTPRSAVPYPHAVRVLTASTHRLVPCHQHRHAVQPLSRQWPSGWDDPLCRLYRTTCGARALTPCRMCINR